MLYVVNRKNHLKYFPFLYNAAGKSRYTYTLVGNSVYRVLLRKEELKCETHLKGNSGRNAGSEESVSYEFQELLDRVARENEKNAEKDMHVLQELEFLQTFIDKEPETSMGMQLGEASGQAYYEIKSRFDKMSTSYSIWVSGRHDLNLKREVRMAPSLEEFYAIKSEVFEPYDAYDYAWGMALGKKNPAGRYMEASLSDAFEEYGIESQEEENPNHDTPAINFEFESCTSNTDWGERSDVYDDGRKDNAWYAVKWLLNAELETVKISAKYGGAPVVHIGENAFCTEVVEAKAKDFDNHGKGVRHIILPETMESFERGAFGGAKYLEKVEFSGKEKEISESCFNRCASLERMQLTETVEKIGDYAFNECTSLNEIVLSSNVTEIGKSAFMACSSLREIEIPNSVQTIGEGLFIACDALKRVKLPAGLTEIPDYMFERCSSLEQLELPEKVTKIGSYAFRGCECLKRLKLSEGVLEIDEDAFEGGITLVTETYREAVEQNIDRINENRDCAGWEDIRYEILDGSKTKRMLEEEAEEQERLELEQRQQEALERKHSELRERAAVTLAQALQVLFRTTEKKKVYVRSKADTDEVLQAVKKVYPGQQGKMLAEQVEGLLQMEESLAYQQFVLSCVADIEETDDEDLLAGKAEGAGEAETDEVSPEAQQALNTLKAMFGAIPFMGARPVLQIGSADDVDAVCEQLKMTLQTSGNMMHAIQLQTQSMNPAFAGSRRAKIELMKLFADVEEEVAVEVELEPELELEPEPESESEPEVERPQSEEMEPKTELETASPVEELEPEPNKTILANGDNIIFCYADSNFTMLPQEIPAGEKIPVVFWQNSICYVMEETFYMVDLMDGTTRKREFYEYEAKCIQRSLEANILPEQEFVLTDITLERLMN